MNHVIHVFNPWRSAPHTVHGEIHRVIVGTVLPGSAVEVSIKDLNVQRRWPEEQGYGQGKHSMHRRCSGKGQRWKWTKEVDFKADCHYRMESNVIRLKVNDLDQSRFV